MLPANFDFYIVDFFNYLSNNVGLKEVFLKEKTFLPGVSVYNGWRIEDLQNQYFRIKNEMQNKGQMSHLDGLINKIFCTMPGAGIETFASIFYFSAYEAIQKEHYGNAGLSILMGVLGTVLFNNLLLYGRHIWQVKLNYVKRTYRVF